MSENPNPEGGQQPESGAEQPEPTESAAYKTLLSKFEDTKATADKLAGERRDLIKKLEKFENEQKEKLEGKAKKGDSEAIEAIKQSAQAEIAKLKEELGGKNSLLRNYQVRDKVFDRVQGTVREDARDAFWKIHGHNFEASSDGELTVKDSVLPVDSFLEQLLEREPFFKADTRKAGSGVETTPKEGDTGVSISDADLKTASKEQLAKWAQKDTTILRRAAELRSK